MKTVRVVSLARLLVLLCIPIKYYQNMSKGIKVMKHRRMHLQTDRGTDAMLIAISPEPIRPGKTKSDYDDMMMMMTGGSLPCSNQSNLIIIPGSITLFPDLAVH